MKKVNMRVMKAIRNSKGRFFGLYTKQGESLNAQLQSETDQTIVVYDRNFNRQRRFSKTSILGVRIAEKNFGKVF
jgi:hypothetical protein|tara:strand:+ start:465 stop:689 length:225 start_codon:yes stop_codon:yes gene_type:complete